MLFYVESGTEFTNQFGDIDAPFYNSLESVLDELAEMLRGAEDGVGLYAVFRKRFLALVKATRGIGWGYGDFVLDTVSELETFFDAGNDRLG